MTQNRKLPRARWPIVLGVCVAVVLLAAVVVAQRRAVARLLIDAWLRALGLEEVGLVVERFGTGAFGVRDFRIGREDDLVVDRIDARYTLSSLRAGHLDELSIRGVRLRGTIDADGVSLGALDPLRRREPGGAGGPALVVALPAANVEIEDVGIQIETPRGPLAVSFAARATETGAGGIAAHATLTARHALFEADAKGELNGTREEFAGDASLDLNAAGEIASGAELAPTAVALAAKFTYTGGQMSAAIEPTTFAISVQRGEETFRVEGETPAVSLALPSTGNGRAAAIHVAATGGRVKLPDVGFEARDVDVDADVDPDTGRPSGSLHIGTLVGPGAPPPLPELTLAGTYAASATAVDFDVTLTSPGQRLVLGARGSHEAATGRGAAHFALEPLVFAADGLQPATLSPALGDWIELASGSVEVRGEVAWGDDAALRGGLDLAMRDLSVSSELGSVERLHAAIHVDGPWPLSTPPKQLVSMARVDFGLALTNGLIDFQLRPDGMLDIASAEWSLAGGTLRTRGAFDLRAQAQDLVLELADIDLAELLVLADVKGLTGSGRLAGRVPIVRRGSLLEIRGGKLSAMEGGGWVRYRSGAGAAGQGQGLNIVIEALENFHYDELTIGLDGDATGEVDVSIHLAGANPDYRDAHPVEFNLNIESRLADLLQNATTVYHIPKRIEQRLREMAEESP